MLGFTLIIKIGAELFPYYIIMYRSQVVQESITDFMFQW